jgi:hypothetical protein
MQAKKIIYASKKNYREHKDVILRLYFELKTKYDNLLEKSINNDCGNIKSLLEITKGNPELRKLVLTQQGQRSGETTGMQGLPQTTGMQGLPQTTGMQGLPQTTGMQPKIKKA